MMKAKELTGILFIGDPHIESHNPDFRSDDYPRVILAKLRWCLDYCEENTLQPVLLGDLFDKPRNNANWLIGELIELFKDRNLIGIYGNHDCADPELNENDSLSILDRAGSLKLISVEQPWRGKISGRDVLIGGSSYRHKIPRSVDINLFQPGSLFPNDPFGVWITHHDVMIPSYEGGRFSPFEIENIDVLVNGHIHTRSAPIVKGQTTWMTPGNISRRSRSEKSRTQAPAVLVLTFAKDEFQTQYVTIPHSKFEDVFYEAAEDGNELETASAFVAGLSELRRRKTSSGAGLRQFLEKNIDQFSEPVADQIMLLADEVSSESGDPQ